MNYYRNPKTGQLIAHDVNTGDIVEMEALGSHDPVEIPPLLLNTEKIDKAIKKMKKLADGKVHFKKEKRGVDTEIKDFYAKKNKGNSKDELRLKVWALKDMGTKNAQIADEVNIPLANVMYYLKKRPADKTSPTPEKVGERAIDKESPKLNASDWSEIKESSNEGISIDAQRFSFPQYDVGEMRRAMTFDEYAEYLKSSG